MRISIATSPFPMPRLWKYEAVRSLPRLMSAKREPDFGALVVGPQQRLLAGLLGGVCVHHVVAEIEILRNPYVQVLPVILLRDEGGLG